MILYTILSIYCLSVAACGAWALAKLFFLFR